MDPVTRGKGVVLSTPLEWGGVSEQEHLALLLRVNTILNSTRGIEEILADLNVEVIETLGAERGFVVMREGERWVPVAAHTIDAEREMGEGGFSRTIIEKVSKDGVGLIALDAKQSEFTYAPSVQMLGLRSVVCAPIRWQGQVRGVVYADHSVKSGAFKARHLELVTVIADQASRTLEAAALHHRLQKLYEKAGEAPQALDLLLQDLSGAAPSATQPVEPSKGCRVFLLGTFRVELDGRPVESWKARKNRELLAYLAAHRGQVIHEEKLLDLFWSKGGEKARHSLQNSVTQLRKLLGDRDRALLVRQHDGYLLGPDCKVDLEEFEQVFDLGRQASKREDWESALEHFRKAEDLAGGEVHEGSLEEWVFPVRERVERKLTACRTVLADYFRGRGKHLLAIELWQRVLDHDNCSEDAYRGLVDAYLSLGNKAKAVRAYQACEKAFREELDLDPPADLKERFESFE